MQDPLAKLLEQSLKEGTWDSSGAFTLDLAKAASRLGQDFAKAYPRQFLLKFIQAGVALESKSLAFKTRGNQLTLEYSEPRLAHFLEYFQFALEKATTLTDASPYFMLFQGLWAALAENVKAIRIYLRHGDLQSGYECGREAVTKLTPTLGRGGKNDNIRLEFDVEQPNWRLFKTLLTSRCAYCPIPLTWNGSSLPRRAWRDLTTAADETWYERYAPHGFRIGESYIGCQHHTIKHSIRLPAVAQRGARVIGVGHKRKTPFLWRPGKTNVLFHKGTTGALSVGAIAQTLDNGISTPVAFVKYGVMLDPSSVRAPDGGLAVLECLSCGLRTDIFGLRLVNDRNLSAASEIIGQHLRALRRDLRVHLFALPARGRVLNNLSIGVGVLGITASLFLPTSGLLAFLTGSVHLGGGLLSQSLEKGHDFLRDLRIRFPDFGKGEVDTSRGRVRRERYRL